VCVCVCVCVSSLCGCINNCTGSSTPRRVAVSRPPDSLVCKCVRVPPAPRRRPQRSGPSPAPPSPGPALRVHGPVGAHNNLPHRGGPFPDPSLRDPRPGSINNSYPWEPAGPGVQEGVSQLRARGAGRHSYFLPGIERPLRVVGPPSSPSGTILSTTAGPVEAASPAAATGAPPTDSATVPESPVREEDQSKRSLGSPPRPTEDCNSSSNNPAAAFSRRLRGTGCREEDAGLRSPPGSRETTGTAPAARFGIN
jgi:hypothetical protein